MQLPSNKRWTTADVAQRRQFALDLVSEGQKHTWKGRAQEVAVPVLDGEVAVPPGQSASGVRPRCLHPAQLADERRTRLCAPMRGPDGRLVSLPALQGSQVHQEQASWDLRAWLSSRRCVAQMHRALSVSKTGGGQPTAHAPQAWGSCGQTQTEAKLSYVHPDANGNGLEFCKRLSRSAPHSPLFHLSPPACPSLAPGSCLVT